jgi:hypothetical protein
MVEDRARIDQAEERVMGYDIGDRDEERNPILVQDDQRHHHEEVEVGFDASLGEVDEDPRRG